MKKYDKVKYFAQLEHCNSIVREYEERIKEIENNYKIELKFKILKLSLRIF